MVESNELASRCMVVGLPGPTLDPETADKLESLRPAGVILFSRNLVDPLQTRELLRSCTPFLREPPLLAIDQEGGRVSRLERWIGPTPPASRLASAGGESVRAFGRATGRALRSIGFNLNFAPVVDLSPPDAANGIADRAFDTTPDAVSRLAREFLVGLQGQGVAGCLKHFPGLGDSKVDSHRTLPTVGRDRPTLEAHDLVPFRQLLDLPPCVMVGHGHYPAFDEISVPATCSRSIVSDLLRGDLGFEGVIVSDDMEMGAISDRDIHGAAAVEAIAAGCDLLLYCSDLDKGRTAARAVAQGAEQNSSLRVRLEQSAARVGRLSRTWPPALDGAVATSRELAGQFDPFRRLA
jgi:beta-N-acetylhexosaminidase